MVTTYGKCLVIVLMMAATSACAREIAGMSRPVHHIIEIGNNGRGLVTDVVVKYGELVVPSGIEHRRYGPVAGVGNSQDVTAIIPEQATISWRSEDRRQHNVIVPIRDITKGQTRFYGVGFYFVDDHVDVYVIAKDKDWPKVLRVHRERMFSSPSSPRSSD